jgi:hypothetical protein
MTHGTPPLGVKWPIYRDLSSLLSSLVSQPTTTILARVYPHHPDRRVVPISKDEFAPEKVSASVHPSHPDNATGFGTIQGFSPWFTP